MNSTTNKAITVGAVLACFIACGCGDDESGAGGGEGGGGGGGGGDASTTSTAPTTGTDASSSGTGPSGTTTSTGGAEACPEIPPNEGDACTPPGEGTCHYEAEAVCIDGSFTNVVADATCADGMWALVVESSGECCPEAPPQSFSRSCAIEGQACHYDGDVVCADGGSIPGSVLTTCEGGSWRSSYEPAGGTCEAESACSAEPPLPGDACDSALFTSDCLWETASACPDGLGFNLITVAQCLPATQMWAVSTLFEGAECASCSTDDPAEDCDLEGMACDMIEAVNCDDGEGDGYGGYVCTNGSWSERWYFDTCE